jgi:hypothetical protein
MLRSTRVALLAAALTGGAAAWPAAAAQEGAWRLPFPGPDGQPQLERPLLVGNGETGPYICNVTNRGPGAIMLVPANNALIPPGQTLSAYIKNGECRIKLYGQYPVSPPAAGSYWITPIAPGR